MVRAFILCLVPQPVHAWNDSYLALHSNVITGSIPDSISTLKGLV